MKRLFILIGLFLFLFSNSYSQNQKIDTALVFINKQFKTYNPYGISYQVDSALKRIISKSEYYQVTYPVSADFNIYISNHIGTAYVVMFRCNLGGSCLWVKDLTNGNTVTKSFFSVDLNSSKETADKVIECFKIIREELLKPNNNPAINNLKK